jgi:SAM-dependent methyltransferase
VAPLFLDWLAPRPGLDWADVGCGTGALSTAIVERAAPGSVVGVDPSEGFVAYARATLVDRRARFTTGDATALPLDAGSLDAVVSALVLNFVADTGAALAEAVRVSRPGAIVAAYVWDYADGMEPIRRFWKAAAALDPAAGELDEGRRFPLCQPDALEAAFTAAGLDDVATRAIDVEARFAGFEDYWAPFLSGVGPAPGYCAALAPDAREALRARLQDELPAGPDGAIVLTARAFAVRGTRV